jgi:hypothetical protein
MLSSKYLSRSSQRPDRYPRKISLKINALDRRISVAPMMEWVESREKCSPLQ